MGLHGVKHAYTSSCLSTQLRNVMLYKTLGLTLITFCCIAFH